MAYSPYRCFGCLWCVNRPTTALCFYHCISPFRQSILRARYLVVRTCSLDRDNPIARVSRTAAGAQCDGERERCRCKTAAGVCSCKCLVSNLHRDPRTWIHRLKHGAAQTRQLMSCFAITSSSLPLKSTVTALSSHQGACELWVIA